MPGGTWRAYCDIHLPTRARRNYLLIVDECGIILDHTADADYPGFDTNVHHNAKIRPVSRRRDVKREADSISAVLGDCLYAERREAGSIVADWGHGARVDHSTLLDHRAYISLLKGVAAAMLTLCINRDNCLIPARGVIILLARIDLNYQRR